MRKLFNLLIFLFLVGIVFQCFLVFLSREYDIRYQIKNKNKTFVIKEKYQSSNKQDHYDFIINDEFTFDIFANLHKTSKLIKKIEYYEDETYKCIYPVFRTKKVKMDVLCYQDNLVYYHTIKGKDQKLDSFVSTLKNYDASIFEDKREKMQSKKFIEVYTDNLIEKHYIAFQNYRGAYIISKKGKENIKKLDYYNHDIYEPKIKIGSGPYFISALYKGEDTFDELVSIRLDKKEIERIKIPSLPITSKLYSVDNNVYLKDKETDKIYQIYPRQKNYEEIKKEKKKKKEKKYLNRIYDHVEETTYYYYLYKKQGEKTTVSRVSKNKSNIMTRLFEVDLQMEKIQYQKDFLYFILDNSLMYYSDKTGLKTLMKNSEIRFNKDLSYYVYIK